MVRSLIRDPVACLASNNKTTGTFQVHQKRKNACTCMHSVHQNKKWGNAIGARSPARGMQAPPPAGTVAARKGWGRGSVRQRPAESAAPAHIHSCSNPSLSSENRPVCGNRIALDRTTLRRQLAGPALLAYHRAGRVGEILSRASRQIIRRRARSRYTKKGKMHARACIPFTRTKNGETRSERDRRRAACKRRHQREP